MALDAPGRGGLRQAQPFSKGLGLFAYYPENAMRRVVVTGLGLVTPLGADVETVWANLIAGKSGAGPITRFDASNQKCQIACEVKPADHPYGFDAGRRVDHKI